ncbi:MAG: NAD(P)/FAD-dependent oxidoreductase [Acutalibacteraceae bacterium]
MLDVLIVGGGAAGLSAAVYAKRAALNITVLEKEKYGFGQIMYSDCVDNYLGFYGVDGLSLGEKFKKHAEALQVPFEYGTAERIEKANDIFSTTLKNGKVIQSRTIIYAAGAEHNKMGVGGEERLIGHGVSYCATCDGAFYRNKTVAVLGGGDTAVSDALYLSEICRKVYLIHRRSEFRAAAVLLQKAKDTPNIEIITETTLAEIRGSACVSEIILTSGQHLAVDGVFIAIGMRPQTDFLKDWINLDRNGYIIAVEDCITNISGFFVAGDVRTKALRQVVTAVSDGANAAISAERFLRN